MTTIKYNPTITTSTRYYSEVSTSWYICYVVVVYMLWYICYVGIYVMVYMLYVCYMVYICWLWLYTHAMVST